MALASGEYIPSRKVKGAGFLLWKLYTVQMNCHAITSECRNILLIVPLSSSVSELKAQGCALEAPG